MLSTTASMKSWKKPPPRSRSSAPPFAATPWPASPAPLPNSTSSSFPFALPLHDRSRSLVVQKLVAASLFHLVVGEQVHPCDGGEDFHRQSSLQPLCRRHDGGRRTHRHQGGQRSRSIRQHGQPRRE